MNSSVTVIMPIYNAERFLAEAVDSVLRQTHRDWELLLLDDGSTDRSPELARAFAARDSRIRAIPAERNAGVAAVRNRGIALARGDYVALLDSDDVWAPDKLERQLDLMEHTGAQISYCSYDFIDENSRGIGKPFPVPAQATRKTMLGCNVIGCSTALVERTLMQAHPFRPEFYHEDYVLWMELLSLPDVRAVGLREVAAHYRRVSGSRSDNKYKAAKERWNIYRRALGMNFFASAGAFIRYAVNGILKYYI